MNGPVALTLGSGCTDRVYGPVNLRQRYGGYTLQKGDNDKKGIWGGQKRSGAAQSGSGPVTTLQTDLRSFGIYTLKIDGDFGRGTEAALKRFQWNAQFVPVHLKNGVIRNIAAQTFCETHTGRLTSATLGELLLWISRGYEAVGDLIRFKASDFSNIKLGSDFKKIGNASVATGEFLLSRDMAVDVKAMDAKALELGITLSFNQCFRVVGIPVRGAVVTPATKSQHLIGHAIDLNIHDGGTVVTSAHYRAKTETENAKSFIEAMKERGLRWGGNFSKMDPPHFDRKVPPTTDPFDFKYYFNQRMISEGQPIPLSGA